MAGEKDAELRRQIVQLQSEIAVYKRLLEEEKRRSTELEVKAALGGGTTDPGWQFASSEPPTPQSMATAMRNMTVKQLAILIAVVEGTSYADLAHLLGIDQSTVKLHLKPALQKLGLPNRAAAIAMQAQIFREIARLEELEMPLPVPIGWHKKKPASLMAQLLPSRPRARKTVTTVKPSNTLFDKKTAKN